MSDVDADVVVIGAGLAGLSCAHELLRMSPTLRVRVLEREVRAGGRVLSIATAHGAIDLGACFAVGADVFPDPARATLPATRIAERGPIRFVDGDVVTSGATPWDCIDALPWSSDERNELAAFRDGTRDASRLSERCARVVGAFFKQIHPGDVRDYIADRQRDALATFFPDHYVDGNRCAVDAFLDVVGAHVTTSTSVTALEEHDAGVTAHALALRNGRRDSFAVRARAAIVATTPAVARALVTPIASLRSAAATFLAAVKTRTYTAVGLIFEAPHLERFRYVVSPSRALDVVIQQASADGLHRTLLCYYSDPAASTIAQQSDDAIVTLTLRELSALGVEGCTRETLRASALRRWDAVGTVIDDAYARSKSADVVQAADHVFLAGDYVSLDRTWGYGTVDAVSSGRVAAAQCRRLLEAGVTS